MKKTLKVICALFLCLTVSACSSQKSAASAKALDEQMKIVADTVGENYVANMVLEKNDALAKFQLQESDIEDIKAEIPMISAHVDTMVIARAKEGKVDVVKTALEAYRQNLVDDTLQYPANIPVIQASSVKVNGNDVYFMMLGIHDESFMDKDTDTQIKELQEQNEAVYNKLI